VEDNGRGFDSEGSVSGLGLRTMEDYVGAVGGSVTISSRPGRGTRIAAQVTFETFSGATVDPGNRNAASNPYYMEPTEASHSLVN